MTSIFKIPNSEKVVGIHPSHARHVIAAMFSSAIKTFVTTESLELSSS